MSIEAQSPVLSLPWLKEINHDSMVKWVEIANKNHPDHQYVRQLINIQRSAEFVTREVLSFEKNKDRQGVVIAVAHREKPYLTPKLIQIGRITLEDAEYESKLNKYADYALFKTHFLLQYPDFISSSQNSQLDEGSRWKIGATDLPGGSFAFKNGFIVGVSGLSTGQLDSALALTIGMRAHLIRKEVALKTARSLRFEEFVLESSRYLSLI